MTVRAVAHTGFTVSDLDRAVRLWCDGLGFVEQRRHQRDGVFAEQVTGVPGASLRAALVQGGGHTVELLQYVAPEGRNTYRPRACDVGSVHVALEVDDLAGVVDRLTAHDCVAAGTPQDGGDGRLFVYVRDPDGVTVELIQPAG